MLSKIYKLTLEKCNDYKSSAPNTTKLQANYFCKTAYDQLFMDMFEISGKSVISNNNNNDGCNYNNNVTNKIMSQRMINDPNKNNLYVPMNNITDITFNCIDYFSEDNKKYIEKLCDIILNDKYPIKKESDNNIKAYYYILRFIPIYFEILCNCYNIFSINDRYSYCTNINKYIEKINQNNRIYVDGQNPNFNSILYMIKNDIIKSDINDLCLYIDELYNQFSKLQKYMSKEKITSKKEIKEKPIEDKNKTAKISEEKIEEKLQEKIEEKKKPKKKTKIPATVRKIVWSTYMGKDNNSGKCLCCDTEDISITNFECGHIKSEKNGGEVTIENLRPICGHCNKSIGGNNMDEFMEKYKIKQPKNWFGIKN